MSRFERWTFLVLITAIMKGATSPTSGSVSGSAPGGCAAPSKPGVRPKGLIITAIWDGSFSHGLHDGLAAGQRSAGRSALEGADAPLHARNGRAQHLPRGFLAEPDAELGGDRIEPTGEQDSRAAGLGLRLVRIDHAAHPVGLAAEVEVVRPRLHARGDRSAP